MNWTDYEKELHRQYNIPADRTITAILQNGTVYTVPKNDHREQPTEHVQPPTKVKLLPPD